MSGLYPYWSINWKKKLPILTNTNLKLVSLKKGYTFYKWNKNTWIVLTIIQLFKFHLPENSIIRIAFLNKETKDIPFSSIINNQNLYTNNYHD